jgi:hypothetical protein
METREAGSQGQRGKPRRQRQRQQQEHQHQLSSSFPSPHQASRPLAPQHRSSTAVKIQSLKTSSSLLRLMSSLSAVVWRHRSKSCLRRGWTQAMAREVMCKSRSDGERAQKP